MPNDTIASVTKHSLMLQLSIHCILQLQVLMFSFSATVWVEFCGSFDFFIQRYKLLNIRIFQNLHFRLLKEAADDIHYRKRYQLMFGALLSVVGKGMRDEFTKQEEFVKMLSAIGDKVKAAKDRDV